MRRTLAPPGIADHISLRGEQRATGCVPPRRVLLLTRQMSPTPDVRAQLQRIVQSSTFRSAEALRNLLSAFTRPAL